MKGILFHTPCITSNKNPALCTFISNRALELKKIGFNVAYINYDSNEVISKNYLFFYVHKLLRIIGYFINGPIRKIGVDINNIPIYLFKKKPYKCKFFDFFKSKKELEKLNIYNNIHIHFLWNLETGIILSESIGIPYLITAHGSDVHETFLYQLENREVIKTGLLNAKLVFFVSKYLRDIVINNNINVKNKICFNGYDPLKFNQYKKKENRFKKIGFIGHLYYIKGADRLPEIFNALLLYNSEFEFKIIGDGSNVKSLKDDIELDIKRKNFFHKCNFLGEVHLDKIPKELSEIDILIVPSRAEGFPTCIIEARALGIPVIGTNIGGIPEAIEKDGIVIEELDMINSFVKSVKYIKENDQYYNPKNISNNALKYSWENIIKNESKFY
jgi:teichuronic acid biosynthesis glycosyltransferase TuaC